MLELQGEAFGAMRQTFGGDTLNTAVYLARCGRAQGLRVDYATALGDDGLSLGMLQRWQDEGLGTVLVQQLPGRLPGLYLIEVDAQGERRFNYWRDQAAARAYFDGPDGCTPLERHAQDVDALYFSGISLAILPVAGQQRLLAVARQVRERGLTDESGYPRVAASFGGAGTPQSYMGTLPAFLAAWGPMTALAVAEVEVEPTGAETELLLQIGPQQLTLVLHGRTAAQPGETE